MICNNAYRLVQISVFVLLSLLLIIGPFHLESLAKVDIFGVDEGALLLASVFGLVFTSIIAHYLYHWAVTFSHHTLDVEISGVYRRLA